MRQLKDFSNKHEKTKSDIETANDYISKYDNHSEDELIEELIKNVRKSKESGTYSGEQMKMFIDMVSPQLNEQQRTKLTNLTKLIEEDEL